MIDETPVDEVFAVVDWQSGKVFERRGDEKVVVLDSDHTGVRVEARDDRVSVRLRRGFNVRHDGR
jgi:hypothetical protein